VTRLIFALVVLAGGLAVAQPSTYFAPIVGRTPAATPVGAVGMGTAIWLPDLGQSTDQSLLFGTGGGTSVPFLLATQAVASVSNFPAQVDAVATAPGVLVAGSSKTLLAFLINGSVNFATLESSGTSYFFRGPTTAIDAGTQIALSALADGGAALLVSDGFRITRFDIDMSSGTANVTQGGNIPAMPTDQSNAIVFDGINNVGFVGGRVLGDIFQFDPRMDAGNPSPFDPALVSQGRLAPPVTGLALYSVSNATYLLAANGQGLTLYDLRSATPASSGFRVIPFDAVGPISAPAGVAVTNLPVGSGFPGGVIAVGDRTQTDLALLRWDSLARQVDGGLIVNTGDGGSGPDAGVPDGGATPDGGGGGGGGGGVPNQIVPLSPGFPVDHGSSCATDAGGPVLLLLLAGLGLLPRRRQRR